MHRVILLCCVASALGAQEPVPAPTPPTDSGRVESLPPAPPSPEQQRFLDGLRIVYRGIAQLKDGMSRVTRAEGTHNTVTQRRAGRFLAGLCGSGRVFLRRGRPQLAITVYEDTVRLKARRLVTQIDSLIAYTPTCEQNAGASPGPTSADLAKRVKTYDAALRDFRLAVGLPVKDDSSKAVRR
jgi:hypothetical protein